jgi:SAM-dependent methyltransferase
MLIHDILGLESPDNVYFVEESYAALKNNILSLRYLENILKDPPDEINGIEDEGGNIIGLALFNPETEESPAFWAVFTNLVSFIPAPNGSSRRFSDLAGRLKLNSVNRTNYKELNTAIIEYYSLALVNRQLCEGCRISKEPYGMVYIESRKSRLAELLDRYKLRGDILEICCGNGMSTLPLHELGYSPLTIDNDKCQICQGLEHEALRPERTIILDATNLSQFFREESFDTVAGFMLGTIYSFNKEIWEKMVSEAVKLLKPGGMMMLTVNKREEMEILKSVLDTTRVKGNIIDNTDDKGIYDQWVYVGTG